MLKENSVNLDEITGKREINLVVTDSGGDVAEKTKTDGGNQPHCLPSQPSRPLQHATVPANSVDQTESIYQGNPDPEKIMRDLPVDEFFKVLEQSTPEQLQTIIRSFEKGARTKGGGKLLRRIIDVPDGPRSIVSTLLWWEWRRPLYNLTVGLAGLPSILILAIFGMGRPAIVCALFYAFFANVCYSLGAPAEVVARACWKEKAENYAPVLLTLGTIFSVILTVCLELLVCSIFVVGSITPRF